MKVIPTLIVITILLFVPLVRGQNATGPANRTGETAPVTFWNRQITVYRSYLNELSPAERADRAQQRLASLPYVAPEWRIVTTDANVGQYTGVMVSVNEQYVLAILTSDLDSDSNQTLQAAAAQATAQLRAALDARTQQRSLSFILRGVALSLVATALLLLGLWVVLRAARRMKARLQQTADARALKLGLGKLDVQPALHSLSRVLAKLTAWALAFVLLYLWLTYVLLRFPYTEPWGQQLGAFLISILTTLGNGIINSIPGLFTVVVIFLLTRIAVRIVISVFHQVEKGDLALPGLHSDTARATRYVFVFMLWIFAIVVAYPYVPGSNTDAFKGVSVLLGVMISLGSAGLVNQIMSGLVVVYSRAFKPGEFVQIGDDFGVVTDVGMLSTKIITRKKEEITIPHAVLTGSKTVNYSRHATGGEAQIGTTVTIGYDAPWRQVHALLLQAASRTSYVRKEPAPRVWQRALSNFYVEYELLVNLDQPQERIQALSELHMHIQDSFNEAGVQIMSPAFESQPDRKVVVPKSQWFVKQAEPNGVEQAPSSS